MHVDVRVLVVAALLILTVCLAVAFARIAFTIRRDFDARFRRIRQQLEENAASLINALVRRDR